MKKFFLALFFTTICTNAAFALSEQAVIDKLYAYLHGVATPPNGEIDIRLGIDPLSGVSYSGGNGGGWDYSSVPNIGFSLGAEYIIPVSKTFRIGGGAQYITPRQADGHQSFDGTISYAPIYAVLQANPVWIMPGIFLKLNAGYAFMFLQGTDTEYVKVKVKENGFTWGLAAGVNITKDWSVEVSYNKYYSKINIDWLDDYTNGSKDMSFSKLGVALMYRIRL